MSGEARIAIIGAGRLGEALIRGLLKAGALSAERVRATVASEARAAFLREEYRVRATAGGNRDAVVDADVVIIAVKPGKVASVADEIGDRLGSGQLVVSLAAAVPMKVVEARAPQDTAVFRAMPNVAMTVGESATAICANEAVTDEGREVVAGIFRTVGTVEWVEESAIDAVTGLSGSGPAFVFHALEAMAAGGEATGLSRDVAYRLARQTLLGAARLAEQTDLTPAEWIEKVKTPGGTTVAGLTVLEERKVRAAFVEAVEAAARRAGEITRELSQKR